MKLLKVAKYYLILTLAVGLFMAIPVYASNPSPSDCVETSFQFFGGGTNCVELQTGEELNTNPIYKVLITLFNFLLVGVGVVAVGAIVFGGFKIITSDGNSQQVGEGGKMIWNTIIGLLLFVLMYALVNFIVPGGLFAP